MLRNFASVVLCRTLCQQLCGKAEDETFSDI